jgi:hypothetical protein
MKSSRKKFKLPGTPFEKVLAQVQYLARMSPTLRIIFSELSFLVFSFGHAIKANGRIRY